MKLTKEGIIHAIVISISVIVTAIITWLFVIIAVTSIIFLLHTIGQELYQAIQ